MSNEPNKNLALVTTRLFIELTDVLFLRTTLRDLRQLAVALSDCVISDRHLNRKVENSSVHSPVNNNNNNNNNTRTIFIVLSS